MKLNSTHAEAYRDLLRHFEPSEEVRIFRIGRTLEAGVATGRGLKPEAQGLHHLQDSVQVGVSIGGEGLVETLPPQARFPGNASHPSGSGDISQGCSNHGGVSLFKRSLQIEELFFLGLKIIHYVPGAGFCLGHDRNSHFLGETLRPLNVFALSRSVSRTRRMNMTYPVRYNKKKYRRTLWTDFGLPHGCMGPQALSAVRPLPYGRNEIPAAARRPPQRTVRPGEACPSCVSGRA